MMKKAISLVPLLIFSFFLFGGCDDDSVSKKHVTMDIRVTDTLGVPLEVFPVTAENLSIDTLLRSKKILQKTGDSIVLESDATNLVFHINTNASWKLSTQKPWGNKSSITWFSTPKPGFGGGNSTTTVVVKESKTVDRRVYLYIVTGDSSCVKKFVFLQKKK